MQNPLKATVALFKGVQKQLAVDAQGAVLGAALHAEYFESVIGKLSGLGANQTGATLSAGLATTYTGLCLSNPAGSTVNLSVHKASGVIEVAPSSELALGLITGFVAGGITVHTTALTVQNALIGLAATALQAKIDAACTLVGTPIWSRWMTVNFGTTTEMLFDSDLRGALVIPPGGYVAIGCTAAGPTSGLLGSFEWEEVAF